MVSPKKLSSSRPSTRKKRSSSSSDNKLPSSQRPKANDNNVDSSGKSVPPSEKAKELCSTDQSKLDGDSAIGRIVDGAAAGKAVTPVTEGTETKKPLCRLVSEFPQGLIWKKTYQKIFLVFSTQTQDLWLKKKNFHPLLHHIL